MVGATAALGCANQGLQVILIEAFQPDTTFNREFINNRVSALTRASENLLVELGVWSDMKGMRIEPYTDMHVWDASGNGSIHFDAAEIAEPSLGHIVENHVTQLALWKRLESHDNVSLICPDRVVGVSRESNGSKVQLESGLMVNGSLVVVADGKKSAVRDMLGIETSGWLYDQHALVATITTEKGHQHTAWQRFMEKGPLAFLPLGHNADKSCSIVWSTSPEQAEQLMALEEQAFCEALTEASEAVLGKVTNVKDRGVFPLELKHAKTYIREGFVLVGDAAHAIHPLAGQGVNLGFLDVIALLEVISNATGQQRDIGGMHTLRKFERERKASNVTMLAAMDGFKRLFSNDIMALSKMRNAGLSIVDNLGPLKQFFVRYAMGLD
ncbi:MAG: UbiH/UbiF/VisC/COQ6 family ubiquinone biosynthesis hydroxylase [Gammaproteobacteria bacterium]|nr:UbiH/UbiF/VisC/COQ6 family ubiquinone biosynthesis hydroxylase [Gammaproteobacteria bacterium]